MKISVTRSFAAAVLLLSFAALPAAAQKLQLQWELRTDLTVLLPPSVQVYEASGTLSDGAPIRAVYASIDLRDQNLQLRAVGNHNERQTTAEAYEQHKGILAINGGYFSGNTSISVFISDGELKAPGLKGSDKHPLTRGAFGLVNRKPEIAWTYPVEGAQVLYKYTAPAAAGHPIPTTTSPKGAQPWHANQAVGGGPVLVKAGKIKDTSHEEGFGGSHLLRHPRTAIGYLDEKTVLMMVVDGRQQASAGVTIKELAQLMQEVGCYDAVNLDGGGSSAMVAADEVVNIPTDIPNGNRNSLRKNATALVLSEALPSVNREVKIIDTDSPHYTEIGLWRYSNHANHYGTTLSRQASVANGNFKAIYRFKGSRRGRYQLAAWWTVDTDANATGVPYVLHHGGKTDTLIVNQQALSGSGRWNVLGDFELGPNDYLELLNKGRGSKITADAVRLVALEQFPEQTPRGDLRIAVISDLNSGLGSATYEWQVDSIISRIPRLWQPDLVICGGDMVAGMGVKDTSTLRNMWAGFDRYIAAPLRQARIPFAFTLGNHDGPRSIPKERAAAGDYWNKPEHTPGLQFVDRSHFPYYYSFVKDGVFFVSWEASSADITEENLAWLAEQFKKPEAQQAKLRFVLGHIPLYSVAQERDSKGNVLNNPEKLRQLLQQYKVHTYISGHQHAYYPGRRGNLELLNAGAAGTGPRSWLTQEKEPVNTVTLMDIFFEQDTIVYTTYDIKHREAKDMTVFEEQELPAAIFGVNGHIVRRDIKPATAAAGVFFSLDDAATDQAAGNGLVKATVAGNKLLISGDYTNLPGKLAPAPDAIALYKGRHLEQGEMVQTLKPKKIRRSKGSFSGGLELTEELAELLLARALYLQVKTTAAPEGAMRAQLYPAGNRAPEAPSLISHNERNVYAVRNIEALYQVQWDKVRDPDSDFTSYTYQLARDTSFQNILLQKSTGRVPHVKLPEKDWYALLGNSPEDKPVALFHRVVASDGKHYTYGKATVLQVMKSNAPLDDFIEVPAPSYLFAGKIEAEGAGYGARWDKLGQLWLADYNGTLHIKQKDGTVAPFSPIKSISIKGKTYTLGNINGIGLDLDGNILLGCNRQLFKIDAATGAGIAVWETPEGKRAITAPRVNEKGEIYAMSLFAEDPNYVLKQSTTDPSTLELLRTLNLPGRELSRTFAMTPNGLTLYFPSPGSPYIQVYSSKDGSSYRPEENISSTAAGTNALEIGPNNTLFAAVRPSGVTPATFHFRDDAKKVMWTLPLPEIDGAEARGIGVSPDGHTLIFCSWDKGGGFYRYVLRREGDAAVGSLGNLPEKAAAPVPVPVPVGGKEKKRKKR